VFAFNSAAAQTKQI